LRVPGVFLQGPKGVGKTTVLFTVLNSCVRHTRWQSPCGPGLCAPNLRRLKVGGFGVKRVFSREGRVGLDMIDLLTRERARLVAIHPDGKRTMYREAFVKIGLPAIERAVRLADIVVMDELGKIELGVPLFTTAVLDILAGPVPVAGVLKDESNPFLDAVRAMPGVRVITVSPGSRERASRELNDAIEDLFTRYPQTPRQEEDSPSPGCPRNATTRTGSERSRF
jgi:nucleoside-triphosphatase THEP1